MPGKKVTKPNTETTDVNFTWDNFAKECTCNKYALVVGSEAILNKEQNITANGDSLKLLLDCTTDYLASMGIVVNNVSDFTRLSNNIHHVREKVLDTIASLDFHTYFDKEIEPTLIQLLETKCFRIVLTTCVDPYLEIAMEKVWGKDGFRILNIYSDEKDILPNELASEEFNELQPTLYYVFGKADTANRMNKFVLSENDAMKTIRNWFDIGRPKSLLNYIQNNTRILSVGCKFDNWLFRFFWFILRGEINNLSNGQVAVEFSPADTKLVNYLRQEKVEIFPDSRTFMKKACTEINRVLSVDGLPKQRGGIFISYAHEDKLLAIQLFNRLVQRGYNVWIDEHRLEPSNEYDARITQAINECTVFMPLLSSQVMYDLMQHKDRYYRGFEWHTAQTRYDNERTLGQPRLKVCPIVAGNYNIRESYHQQVEECIKSATAYELASGTFESLAQILNRL